MLGILLDHGLEGLPSLQQHPLVQGHLLLGDVLNLEIVVLGGEPMDHVADRKKRFSQQRFLILELPKTPDTTTAMTRIIPTSRVLVA